MDKVEIKQKNAPDSKEIQNTFAFVTIGVDDYTLQQCLQEFKTQQFRGRFLQVTVARENFLEKLKREREEAAQLKLKKDDDTKQPVVTVKASLPTMSKGDSSESSSDESSSEDEAPNVPPAVRQIGKPKTFKSSDSEPDSDGNEDNLILKKKSKMFLENGKVNCFPESMNVYFFVLFKISCVNPSNFEWTKEREQKIWQSNGFAIHCSQ